jgi:hypothetical protein
MCSVRSLLVVVVVAVPAAREDEGAVLIPPLMDVRRMLWRWDLVLMWSWRD